MNLIISKDKEKSNLRLQLSFKKRFEVPQAAHQIIKSTKTADLISLIVSLTHIQLVIKIKSLNQVSN